MVGDMEALPVNIDKQPKGKKEFDALVNTYDWLNIPMPGQDGQTFHILNDPKTIAKTLATYQRSGTPSTDEVIQQLQWLETAFMLIGGHIARQESADAPQDSAIALAQSYCADVVSQTEELMELLQKRKKRDTEIE